MLEGRLAFRIVMIRKLALFAWIFVVLFALSAVANAFFVLRYMAIAREVHAVEKKIGEGRQLQTSTQNLVTELILIGSKYPNVLPVLQRYGIPVPMKPASTAPSTPTSPKKTSN